MKWNNYRPLRRPVKRPLQLGGRLRHHTSLLGPETALGAAYVIGILLFLVFHRNDADKDKSKELAKAAPRQETQMIYLPPPKVPAKPAPTPPPTPKAQPQPTPEPPASVAAPRTTAVGRAPAQSQSQQSRDLAADATGKGEAKTAETGPPPRPDPVPKISAQANPTDPNPVTRDPLATNPLAAPARHEETQEDEAHRLFGNNRNGPTGRPERAFGGMPLPWQTGDQRCLQVPENGDTMTVISARVIDFGGKPVPGAFLQILGTPYSTYSDGGGNYALRFSISLVANCRTQAVRVTAGGYSLRDLILSTGVSWNNDIPLQRN
ncbi:MAG: carboxypeptidase-like regulatory domain-containing protein [Gemmatimonadota bacterium]